MMLRALGLLLVGLLFASVPVVAQETLDTDQAKILKILQDIPPGPTVLVTPTSASVTQAENALVALGKTALPAMKAMLVEQATAQTHPDDVPGVQPLPQWKATYALQALDGAIIRLAWGVDPQQLMARWMGQFNDWRGNAYVSPMRPARLTDAPFGRAFPTTLFYTINYYDKGWIQNFPPKPMDKHNVFVVMKDGRLRHMAAPKALQDFFITHVAVPVPAQEDATPTVLGDVAAAWIFLTQGYYSDMGLHFSIPADGINIAQKTGGYVVEAKGFGMDRETPRLEMHVTMTFGAKKDDPNTLRLLGIAETQRLMPAAGEDTDEELEDVAGVQVAL